MINFTPLWDWFRTLHETTGVNLTIFYDPFDRARFFHGFLTSLRLMALCLVASVVIGVVGAWIQRSRVALLRMLDRHGASFETRPSGAPQDEVCGHVNNSEEFRSFLRFCAKSPMA